MLDVHDNAMVGLVPSAVWKLSALQFLDWSGNTVNSSFPSGAISLNLTYVQTARRTVAVVQGMYQWGEASMASTVPRLACSDCGIVSAIVTGGCRWRTRH